MAQVEISPFDNDRLKTQKVRSNLVELGAWPDNPEQQPSFLRPIRATAALLESSLARLASLPVLAPLANQIVFSDSLNAKFGSAFRGLRPAPSGLPAGAIAFANWKDGTFYFGGNTLADFLTEDLVNWNAFDPDTDVVPGSGIQTADPALAAGLVAALTDGFIMVATITGVTSDVATSSFLVDTLQGDFDAYSEIKITSFDPDNDANQASRLRTDLGIIPLDQSFSVGTNVTALESTPAAISISTNGEAVETQMRDVPLASIDHILMEFNDFGTGSWWEKMVIYPAGFAALNTLSVA